MNTRPATDKQVSFIERLISERDTTLTIPEGLTSKDASAMIEALLAAPRQGEAPAPVAIDEEKYNAHLAAYLANIPAAEEYNRPHPDRKGDELTTEPCSRCGGSGLYADVPDGLFGGGLPRWEREGRVNAYCYKCGGDGKQVVKISTVRRREAARVKAVNKAREAQIKNAPATVRDAMEHAAREQATTAAMNTVQEAYPEGEKLDGVPVTVTKISEFLRPAYGYDVEEHTRVITFTDADGQDFVWFSAAAAAFKIEEGDAGQLHATVKRVTEHNDRLQVTVLRARLKNTTPARLAA